MNTTFDKMFKNTKEFYNNKVIPNQPQDQNENRLPRFERDNMKNKSDRARSDNIKLEFPAIVEHGESSELGLAKK